MPDNIIETMLFSLLDCRVIGYIMMSSENTRLHKIMNPKIFRRKNYNDKSKKHKKSFADERPLNGSCYYMTHKITDLTLKDITFTAKCDITTSEQNTVIDGVTYDGCTFNINNLDSGNQAVRFYNESNNGNVRNLTVKDCAFNHCFQGVFMSQINGVHISECTFDTTKHNAIALQSSDKGAVNYKQVVIENNVFQNIGDRIIRFGEIGADTQLTMKYNVASDSGDKDGEVMKAVKLAEGITYDIDCNNWGEGTTIPQDQLKDKG